MTPRRRSCRSVSAVLFLIGVSTLARLLEAASILIPSTGSASCNAATEYYDASVLGCNRCIAPIGSTATPNALLVPDTTNLNALGLASSCVCRRDAYWTSHEDAYCGSTWPAPCNLDACTRCEADRVPSSDASLCLPCGNSTLGIDAMTNDCECAAGSILIEKDATGEYLDEKECVACADGTHRDPTTNTCRPCADPTMALTPIDGGSDKQCACKPGYQLVASLWFGVTKCIPLTRSAILNAKVSLSVASTISFSDFDAKETGSPGGTTVAFASDLVQDTFLLAASECYFYRNEKQIPFCQALGNLCVLQHMNPGAPPCALMDLIQKSGRATSANGVNGWYYTLPFLDYKTNAPNVLESTKIGMKMSFDETAHSDTHDHLEFMLATYSVNGTLKGFYRLTNQFLYCLDRAVASPPSSAAIPMWTRFGVSTGSHHTCDLSTLRAENMELYELFLVDKSKSEGVDGRYVPVPVQNLNYADARGLYINQNQRTTDAKDDFLSNRFFLFDVASGVQVGESKTRVYRYADAITITINTQPDDPSAIYPPLLTISYVDTQVASQAASVRFQVVFASDTSRFRSTAVTLFVVACVLAGMRVLLHTFTWQRRNTRNEEMALTAWHSFSHLLTSLVSNLARAFFAILFLLCVYFLLFFKLQSSVFLLLPAIDHQLESARKDEYYPFRVVLPLAFSFQLVTVMHRVYQQTQVQMCLIDWEKPRAKIIDLDSSNVQPAPVSIWRTILVANEWNKLQTVRKTSLRFTLIVLLFLLYGCDMRSLAMPIPRAQMVHLTTKATIASTLTTDQDLSMNVVLRFASVASLWLLICVVQRLWKWLIFERFFDEPREQVFVDLCTIAKVSCFFLDETYHGYYLHCRSPYPFADGSMSEIVQQLKQETAGLTVGRGLDTSIPDCQTFEMFFTRKWKRKYIGLYNSVHGINSGAIRRSTRSEEDPGASPHKPSLSPTRPGRGGGGRGGRGGGRVPHWQLQSSKSFLPSWDSANTTTTQMMVQSAAELADFLKSFIDNLDDQFRWRIYRMETCVSRFFGIPPEMSATRQSFFLPDTESRFTRVLCLGIENDLMLMNILCFTAWDLWLQNHAISALLTYLLEGSLMAFRTHFGGKNVARNSLVDPRFLI